MEEQEKIWTARRKADVVLQILRQTTTVVDVARGNDLTPDEVQGWVDTFLKNGENGLKTNLKDIHTQYQREIKELKTTIGELYIDNAILKKARALWGDENETES
jgi:transposase-like protein